MACGPSPARQRAQMKSHGCSVLAAARVRVCPRCSAICRGNGEQISAFCFFVLFTPSTVDVLGVTSRTPPLVALLRLALLRAALLRALRFLFPSLKARRGVSAKRGRSAEEGFGAPGVADQI